MAPRKTGRPPAPIRLRPTRAEAPRAGRATDFDPPPRGIADAPDTPFVPRDLMGQPQRRTSQGRATDFDPEPRSLTQYLVDIFGGQRFATAQGAAATPATSRPPPLASGKARVTIDAGPSWGTDVDPRLAPRYAAALEQAQPWIEKLPPIPEIHTLQGPVGKKYPLERLSPFAQQAVKELLELARPYVLFDAPSMRPAVVNKPVTEVSLAELTVARHTAGLATHASELLIDGSYAAGSLELAKLMHEDMEKAPPPPRRGLADGTYESASTGVFHNRLDSPVTMPNPTGAGTPFVNHHSVTVSDGRVYYEGQRLKRASRFEDIGRTPSYLVDSEGIHVVVVATQFMVRPKDWSGPARAMPSEK